MARCVGVRSRALLLGIAALVSLAVVSPAQVPPPGPIKISVNATQVSQRILHSN